MFPGLLMGRTLDQGTLLSWGCWGQAGDIVDTGRTQGHNEKLENQWLPLPPAVRAPCLGTKVTPNTDRAPNRKMTFEPLDPAASESHPYPPPQLCSVMDQLISFLLKFAGLKHSKCSHKLF